LQNKKRLKMTPLLQWKKEQGLTYEGVIKRLGGKWKRAHLVNVFNGNGIPGVALFFALKALTGLKDNEILVNFNLPGGDHDGTCC
jgi:hypothetical protein